MDNHKSNVHQHKKWKKVAKVHGRIKEVDGEEDRSREEYNEAGEKITPFNLEEENEDGYFEESGNYVWRKEDRPVQEDAWLDNITTEQISNAEKAKANKESKENDRLNKLDEFSSYKIILSILLPDETVLQAIQRLGKKKKKRKFNSGTAESETKENSENKKQFNELTEAADYLLHNGIVDIYQDTSKNIQSRHSCDASASSSAVKSIDGSKTLWEYKGLDGKIYGPYPTENFINWQSQGYFTGNSAVLVRRIGQSSCNRKKQLSAEEELMNDMDSSEEETEVKDSEDVWENSDKINFSIHLP